MSGVITSVNTSSEKGTLKTAVDQVEMRPDWGIIGDAHAGPGDRQVSLLAQETVDKWKMVMAESVAVGGEGQESCDKVGVEIVPGAFAENLTVRGIDLPSLDIGTSMTIGKEVEAEVSKIGKKCHNHCAIFHQVGRCPMPTEGIFIRIIKGGVVRPGDEVKLDAACDCDCNCQ